MDIKLTKEGYDQLKAELEKLESEGRPKIAERLKEAISQGDLSENADYEQAKEDQGKLEGKILEIKQLLTRATIVKEIKGSKISIGSTIKIKASDGAERIYNITDSHGANPVEGKISYDSPIGSAFLNHKKGDSVEVETPSGNKKYKILEVD